MTEKEKGNEAEKRVKSEVITKLRHKSESKVQQGQENLLVKRAKRVRSLALVVHQIKRRKPALT